MSASCAGSISRSMSKPPVVEKNRPSGSGLQCDKTRGGRSTFPAGTIVGSELRLSADCGSSLALPSPRLRLELFGQPEGQVEGLAGVESGVAHRLVPVVEIAVRHLFRAAEAFGHIVAG